MPGSLAAPAGLWMRRPAVPALRPGVVRDRRSTGPISRPLQRPVGADLVAAGGPPFEQDRWSAFDRPGPLDAAAGLAVAASTVGRIGCRSRAIGGNRGGELPADLAVPIPLWKVRGPRRWAYGVLQTRVTNTRDSPASGFGAAPAADVQRHHNGPTPVWYPDVMVGGPSRRAAPNQVR